MVGKLRKTREVKEILTHESCYKTNLIAVSKKILFTFCFTLLSFFGWAQLDDYVLYYPFNGNANDESGNLYHGTIEGAVLTTDRFGTAASAFSFDGVSDIAINSGTGVQLTDDFTYNLWVNPSAYTIGGSYLIFDNAANYVDYILAETGELYTDNYLFDGVVTTGVIPIDSWTMVTLTRTGSTFDIYINGALDISGSTATTGSVFPTEIGPSFFGAIDDVRIYDRGLSASEVSNLFPIESGIPTILSFTPESGLVGSSVTISGANFDATPANNIVYFGATKASVTAASDTELMVTVPAGATYEPITVQVAGLTAYSNKPFVVTFNGGGTIDVNTLLSKVDFATGSGPNNVAIGDLDGDGKPDLVVTNNNANTVSVFRNTSTSGSIETGSFATQVDFTTGTIPYGVAIGDIDGDGKPDIAVTNQGSTSVSIFRNTS